MKYYKAEDVIKTYNEAVRELIEAEMKEFDLGDFTECSFNVTQLKLISRKIESIPKVEVADLSEEAYEVGYTDGQMAERKHKIEVSEDAVSREAVMDIVGLDPGITSWQFKMLEELPSVIPKPKEGEWIEHKERTIVRNGNFVDFFPTEYECSNCGLRQATYFINSSLSNYCPNCGSRMKGADNE